MGEKREKLHQAIDQYGLESKEALKASEELDQEVLKEMLKDPKNEVIYLKQMLLAKDCEIKRLQMRLIELSCEAQMNYEAGDLTAIDSVKVVVTIANKGGLQGEFKANGTR